jgi:Type I phosphodiesterase / nucleotide pyrophosphatase
MHIRSLFLFTSWAALSIIGCSSDTNSSGGGGGKSGASGSGGESGAHQGGKGGSTPTSGAGPTDGGAAGDGEAGDDGQAGDDGEAGDDGQAGAAGAPSSLAIEATRRVLLISVDGLHELDLAKWIAGHPTSTLAKLAGSGVNYTAAHTPTPSDSFPGLLALITGGTPISTGVFYDDSYDRTLYAPGSKCVGSPGTEIVFDESVEYDDSKLFSGGIDAANLPYAKDANGNCKVVYPHDFLKVNTLFEVVRASGGYTAWSDKHAAYDLVNGPSGSGVQDLYTPEINSLIVNGGVTNGVNLAATKALCDGSNSLPVLKVTDYTTCGPAVMAYDDTKVQAIINQIDGKRSDGSAAAPVPTVFGMNFQEVSVGQKLAVGGYTDATGTPSVLLAASIAHVDASLGKMVTELAAKGLEDSTLIIVSSKHGQSPIDPTQLHMEAGGNGTADVADPVASANTVDAALDNSPSAYVNPNSDSAYQTHGHLQTDDVGLLWLQDQTEAPAIVAKLQADAAALHANTLPAGTIFSSSISSGAALAALFGDPLVPNSIAAARAPNAFVQPNAGVVYSSSTKKISEHGGGTSNDTGVALLISLPAFGKPHTVSAAVGTTQVAPTILRALGLDPQLLQSVTLEHTAVLPDLF